MSTPRLPGRLPARRLAAPALGLAAALLLAGCGSGQRAQTYQEKAVAEATNDAVGSIAVRNIAVLGPPTGIVLQEGADAPMSVTFVNEGAEDDVLVSATTPAAASVDVLGPTDQVEVPRLNAAAPGYRLVLRDLTRDLQTGSYIDMTLTFERNGTRTMLVPVQTTPDGAPREEGEYHVAETDSNGDPIVEDQEETGGDNVIEQESDPAGDQGGSDSPPSE